MELPKVHYRPFRPGDGAAVVEILREHYKDDYFHRECYDVSYLERASRDGRRILYVAESPESGIIGVTGGYYRDFFPGSYELGLHVVKKAYQGLGIAKGLLKYSADEMGRMRVWGIYGMAVTFNDSSQYECESIGINATGFWLGRHRADRSFFTEKPRSPKLHSIVVARQGVLKNSGPLYAPMKHRAFIADIYQSMGAPFSFAQEGECSQKFSSYCVKDTEDAHNRDIYISTIGSDFALQVPGLLRGGSGDSCTVFLNMLDSGCERAYEELIGMGFYFTGVHPFHEDREYILMHMECEGGYAWDEMRLTPANLRMLDYILKARKEDKV